MSSLKSEIEHLKSKDVVRTDKERMDGLITERLNDFREQEKRKAIVMVYMALRNLIVMRQKVWREKNKKLRYRNSVLQRGTENTVSEFAVPKE